MGPGYPIFDKGDPPEDSSGGEGQEVDKGDGQGQEELEQKAKREKEEKDQGLAAACNQYMKEIKAAKDKLESHTAGKAGIIVLPDTLRGHPLRLPTQRQDPNADTKTNVGDEITDDEEGDGYDKNRRTQFVEIQDPYVPGSANKCVTNVAEVVKHLKRQNKIKTHVIEDAKAKAKQDQIYRTTKAESREPLHSVYLAGGATPKQDVRSKNTQDSHNCMGLVCPYVVEEN